VSIDLHGLHNTHRGQRCFFLGNGPSLNKLDLSLLERELVWASNRAYLLFDRISWRPSFYVLKDPDVIKRSADALNSLALELPATVFFYPEWVIGTGVIKERDNICWFREVPGTETDYPSCSLNADNGIVHSSTVATMALQLAVWMGFNPIILIGCDMSYVGTEADHFDPRYLDGSQHWILPDVDKMIAELKEAKRAADAQGITILNATAGGNLEAFSRVSYIDIVRKRD
jgi:hypothetical protein